MGIVNVTPDSFSDGGLVPGSRAAVAHGLELEREGAAILDIGGESTRPGAEPVSRAEELRRVMPVIEGLSAAGTRAQISIDTSKARGGRGGACRRGHARQRRHRPAGDPAWPSSWPRRAPRCASCTCSASRARCRATPATTMSSPTSRRSSRSGWQFAVAEGIAEERILLDPGIGFGKTVEHNLELLRRLDELVALGRPVVIGTSRKSFLGRITGRDVDRPRGRDDRHQRARLRARRAVFRVHDVGPTLMPWRSRLLRCQRRMTPRRRRVRRYPTK